MGVGQVLLRVVGVGDVWRRLTQLQSSCWRRRRVVKEVEDQVESVEEEERLKADWLTAEELHRYCEIFVVHPATLSIYLSI